jgi:23S rRNA (cytosine1962-C5)-methyltransferase
VIKLKRGREKSLKRRHPWIFSGAVEKATGKAGDTVEVQEAGGKPIALAAYSPKSQIRARVWTFDVREAVDAAFFRNRVQKALALREGLPAAKHTNAMRLINGENDGLPGLIVDRYADVLVAQFLAAGVERWRDPILDALVEISGCEAVFERSDAEVRKLEGLEPRVGFARGNRNATRCPIIEHGLNFRVDVEQGQKTGFFLDQRENRQRVRALAAGREVLDGFSYTGGFAISALAGGAKRVTAVESSAPALEVAKENLAANPLDASRVDFVQADVFAHLRKLRDGAARFDLIVLDPPKFAPTAAQVKNAARAYKDINLWALKLLAPGGLLATFS